MMAQGAQTKGQVLLRRRPAGTWPWRSVAARGSECQCGCQIMGTDLGDRRQHVAGHDVVGVVVEVGDVVAAVERKGVDRREALGLVKLGQGAVGVVAVHVAYRRIADEYVAAGRIEYVR